MANDTNQHFITKAYLDKFVHPDSSDSVLYPYRRGGSPCRPRGTKRLGSAINFYRQRDEGILSDKLDDSRTWLEKRLFDSSKNTAGAMARCVFNDAFVPAYEDRVCLEIAAAFLFCGAPMQIHNAAMMHLLASQMDLLNSLKQDEVRAEYREKFGELADQQIEKDREEILKGKLFVHVESDKDLKQLGFSSLEFIKDIVELLSGMRLTIVDCHYRSFFLTSDNPVVRTFQSSPRLMDDEMWFPISYKRGLLWHRRKLGPRACLNHSESRAINRRMVKNAYKFVYSPRTDEWIAAACRDEHSEQLYGDYGTLEEVFSQSLPAYDEAGNLLGEVVDLVAAMKSGKKMDVVGI